jgi:hypothetical protein
MKTLAWDLHDGCSGRVLLGIPTRNETYEIAVRTVLPRRGLRSLGQKSNAFLELETIAKSIDRSQP